MEDSSSGTASANFSRGQSHHLSSFIAFASKRCLIGLAGTPPTSVYGSTSFTTTAPLATVAPSPIVTPLNIVTLFAIHTSLPIIMSPLVAAIPPLISPQTSGRIALNG